MASVRGMIPGTEAGLGPRFNLDSCAGCHIEPAVGGSSPAINPQIEVGEEKNGRTTKFLRSLRETVRFAKPDSSVNPDGTPDGGVHALFTISWARRCAGLFSSAAGFPRRGRPPERGVPHSDSALRR